MTTNLLTIPNVAADMGICPLALRRLLTLGRISGVRKPAPRLWHLLTRTEVELIREYVKPPEIAMK